MDGVAGKSRDRIDSGIWPGGTGSGIDSALGPACGRKLTGEAERHCGDEAGVAGRPLRDPDRGAEIHGRSARLLAPGPGVIKVGHWCEPNGTWGGSVTAMLRLASSSMIAWRASPPISS